jgi:amidohydrolase
VETNSRFYKIEEKDTIKIIHQHAEEAPPGGAKSIVDSGALETLDNIFGIHLLPMNPVGYVGYHSGFSMAGRSYFKLRVQGVGGHGSSPHMANDAIVAGSYFVTAVQTVISRRLNPFDMGVITIGSFDGKGTFNVIKDRVELEGDIRYMTVETKEIIEKEIRRIVSGIEAEFGVQCEITYTSDYPPLYNNPEVTAGVKASLEGALDPDFKQVVEYPMMSPSDDFAYYLEKIPGCYFYIGCTTKGIERPYFNHNPKFDMDEDALIVAAKSVGYVVCGYYGLE